MLNKQPDSYQLSSCFTRVLKKMHICHVAKQKKNKKFIINLSKIFQVKCSHMLMCIIYYENNIGILGRKRDDHLKMISPVAFENNVSSSDLSFPRWVDWLKGGRAVLIEADWKCAQWENTGLIFSQAPDGNRGTGCSLQVWMKQLNTPAFLARELQVFIVFHLVVTSMDSPVMVQHWRSIPGSHLLRRKNPGH